MVPWEYNLTPVWSGSFFYIFLGGVYYYFGVWLIRVVPRQTRPFFWRGDFFILFYVDKIWPDFRYKFKLELKYKEVNFNENINM